MTVMNALNGLVSDLLDRLAEKVAGTEVSRVHTVVTTEEHLRDDAGGRALIAKMARSEVKNYLAELAEQAGRPFGDPVSFIRMSREGFEALASLPDFEGHPKHEIGVVTCETLGHDPRVHSPNGRAEIRKEQQ